MALDRYREIRSARFPLGLPDRTDTTVLEAFADAWLMLEHAAGSSRLVGVAEDYDAARTWLTEAEPGGGTGDSEVSGPDGPAPR